MPLSFEDLQKRADDRKTKKQNNDAGSQMKKIVLVLAAVFVLVLLIVVGTMQAYPEKKDSLLESAPVETAAPSVPETEPVPETTAAPTVETTAATEPPVETEPEETEPPRIHYDFVPLYFQTDYPDVRFGRGTIESSGCSITSLAMVASYLTGHEYLPDELADYFGGHGINNMQRLEYGNDMLQLPWRKAANVDEVLTAARGGDIAILLMNQKSIFTDNQHFIVLAGMTDDGKFIINDPYEPNYENWQLVNAFNNGFKAGDLICGFSGGWIYDVSEMPEEPFIYKEIKPYVEPRYPGITLTTEEEDLLAKIIWLEARGEPYEGQQAIAEVVFNRLLSPSYPDDLNGVLHSDNQFPSTEHLKDAEPNQTQYDAIEDALEGPYILPVDVTHFATYAVNEEVWGTIGGHTFCYRWGTMPKETTPETLPEESDSE